jgi:4-hydroxyacetophenone monooxygenase
MTPPHPPVSARPVLIDTEYSILDAIQRDNVTLVTDGIRRITGSGVESNDGTLHEVDVIVYATGFKATEYLYPMRITGRGGLTVEQMWAEGGARAYRGCMIPNFPNLWSLYGPNTNGGLNVAAFHELVTVYAMQCMERLILTDKQKIEVKGSAYWRYAQLIDERNNRLAWSDPRAHNYYWTRHGRSATQCPLDPGEVWKSLRHPDFDDLTVS